MNRFTGILMLGTIALVGTGCSGDNPTDPGPGNVDTVADYMKDLPAWNDFSPQMSPQPATATGPAEMQTPITLDIEVVSDSGTVEIIPDVTYECQSQPFTLTENPQQIAIYSPDVELLWPGALIQGKSHRDGLGSLLGLPIAERTPIEVSIPSLSNNDNFRTVDTPSQAEVAQAIGSMIGGATASGLSTPSTITFEQSVYHSEKQFALEAGISGRYLGFEASAQGSVDKDASKTTITAQFYQKMFDVVVAPPQTPDAFFNDDFTSDKLQAQVDLGRIGPDNLPVYISNVVYGRMMMFSMTSTASEEDIRATMRAAYESIGGGGAVNLSVKQKKILEQSEIRVTSLGGNADATLAVIRSGNWADYFTDNAPLTSASPLSYTFRNLSDGSIARVSESTDYNITTCEAKAATPGTFNFLDLQSLSLPISTPAKALVADVNGDENDDIIWNSLTATSNETVVGISNGDGTFFLANEFSHSATPADPWSKFQYQVGDFNDDGMDDIVWSKSRENRNRTYVALSNGDGTFTEMPELLREELSWGNPGYEFRVGDIDGKNGDDLIWNARIGINRTYVSLSNGDGTFETTAASGEDHYGTAWTGNEKFDVGDVNNDGRDDLIWWTEGVSGNGGHHVYFGVSVSDTKGEHFQFRGLFNRGNEGWEDYEVVVGDVDGKNGVDLVWIASSRNDNPIHRDLATGTGSLEIGPLQFVAEGEGPFELAILDVNGDGRDDILLNTMGTVNRSFIGLGQDDAFFDFGRISQDHPSFDDWGQFNILVGDFNGDNRDDVVYNNADASNDVYVGLTKE